MTGIRIKEEFRVWRMDRSLSRIKWGLSTIVSEIESYRLSRSGDREEEYEVSRQTAGTSEADVSAVCLGE